MSKVDDCVFGYIKPGEAWYAEANRQITGDRLDSEIMFGAYVEGGGTLGEMAMRWHKVGERLEIFNDAWAMLAIPEFQNVLEKLAEHGDKALSKEEFVKILEECGFEDLTEYKNKNDSGMKM